MEITKEFDLFYKWVRSNLNLDLFSYKQRQLQRRINTVMRSSGAKDLVEYKRLIESDSKIRDEFLDYITINVTDFYRNPDIFEDFEKIIINELIPKYRNIKVWSAACSIGSEPYTVAMILDKHGKLGNGQILGTDLDLNVLKRAENGRYLERELKNINPRDLNKYFVKDGEYYQIDDRIKKSVEYRQHDLILDKYPKNYHAVICRNVIIYFKNETKDEIYEKISDSLVQGGILFTGATETIGNPERFGLEKLSTFIYRKI